MLWGGGVDIASIVRCEPMELPMQTLNNLSRSLIALEPASTLIAVIEMSLSSWLVAGIVPGIERQPLKKLAVDESALLRLLHRWREEGFLSSSPSLLYRGSSLSGRVGVKRFQTAPSILVSMSLARSSLLFGIGTLALP